MKLYAISDLHLHYKENRAAIEALPERPDDWLILGGDIGEKQEQMHFVLDIATRRFGKVFWVPGNHELWTLPSEPLRGMDKYMRFVNICRDYGARTPEDPFEIWEGEGGPTIIAPLFNLYDYSFRPDHVDFDDSIEWALEGGVLCNDEQCLHPDPFETKMDWCAERLKISESRLEEAHKRNPEASFVLINHFPLRYEHVRLWRIPRFSIWCGTKATENWHKRFPVKVVVYGHLHVRATDYRDGVRFEEVSLGYPRHWRQERGIEHYLREILPGEPAGVLDKLKGLVR